MSGDYTKDAQGFRCRAATKVLTVTYDIINVN